MWLDCQSQQTGIKDKPKHKNMRTFGLINMYFVLHLMEWVTGWLVLLRLHQVQSYFQNCPEIKKGDLWRQVTSSCQKLVHLWESEAWFPAKTFVFDAIITKKLNQCSLSSLHGVTINIWPKSAWWRQPKYVFSAWEYFNLVFFNLLC